MMKKNLLKLFVLTLLLGLGLTSCSKDDDDVVGGELYSKFSMYTDDYTGYFGQNKIYNTKHISINGSGYYDIGNIYFVGTQISISGNLENGDLIRNLTIDVEGVGKYFFPAIPVYTNNETISFDTRNDRDLYNFMKNAIDQLNRYNDLDILVSGQLIDRYGSIVEGEFIQIDMRTMLEVNVR